jgi:hypothetical protein
MFRVTYIGKIFIEYLSLVSRSDTRAYTTSLIKLWRVPHCCTSHNTDSVKISTLIIIL